MSAGYFLMQAVLCTLDSLAFVFCLYYGTCV